MASGLLDGALQLGNALAPQSANQATEHFKQTLN